MFADRLQALGKGGSLEAIGQAVQPALILGLQVHERLHGIAPALRPATALLRPPVVNTWQLLLAAFAEATLSLCVAEPHDHTVSCYVTACQTGIRTARALC